jgi:hypothetical protein
MTGLMSESEKRQGWELWVEIVIIHGFALLPPWSSHIARVRVEYSFPCGSLTNSSAVGIFVVNRS